MRGLNFYFSCASEYTLVSRENCVTCASHKPAVCNRQLDSWGALSGSRAEQLLGHAPLVFAIASQTSGICIRSHTLSLNEATPTSLVSMAPQTSIASPSWPPPLRTSHRLTKPLPQSSMDMEIRYEESIVNNSRD
jgi:hypothetical protein